MHEIFKGLLFLHGHVNVADLPGHPAAAAGARAPARASRRSDAWRRWLGLGVARAPAARGSGCA